MSRTDYDNYVKDNAIKSSVCFYCDKFDKQNEVRKCTKTDICNHKTAHNEFVERYVRCAGQYIERTRCSL